MAVDVDAMTRDEWRELGFFYDQDEAAKAWRIVGSRDGIRRFVRLLRDYVSNPASARLSEHAHYGPHMYLKVVTATGAAITRTAIAGAPEDLLRLADVVEAKLTSAPECREFTVASDWTSEADFSLLFEVRPDGFHPADADPLLSSWRAPGSS